MKTCGAPMNRDVSNQNWCRWLILNEAGIDDITWFILSVDIKKKPKEMWCCLKSCRNAAVSQVVPVVALKVFGYVTWCISTVFILCTVTTYSKITTLIWADVAIWKKSLNVFFFFVWFSHSETFHLVWFKLQKSVYWCHNLTKIINLQLTKNHFL